MQTQIIANGGLPLSLDKKATAYSTLHTAVNSGNAVDRITIQAGNLSTVGIEYLNLRIEDGWNSSNNAGGTTRVLPILLSEDSGIYNITYMLPLKGGEIIEGAGETTNDEVTAIVDVIRDTKGFYDSNDIQPQSIVFPNGTNSDASADTNGKPFTLTNVYKKVITATNDADYVDYVSIVAGSLGADGTIQAKITNGVTSVELAPTTVGQYKGLYNIVIDKPLDAGSYIELKADVDLKVIAFAWIVRHYIGK